MTEFPGILSYPSLMRGSGYLSHSFTWTGEGHVRRDLVVGAITSTTSFAHTLTDVPLFTIPTHLV
jgi:hypothetical protein